MSAMASQITSLTIVYSTVHSGVDQRKHQTSASLTFVRGIHWSPVNSPHKGPVTRKCFHLMTSSCIAVPVRHILTTYGACQQLVRYRHSKWCASRFRDISVTSRIQVKWGFTSNPAQGWQPALIPSWWRHQMETFSALLAFCAGNSPVPGLRNLLNSFRKRKHASHSQLGSLAGKLCWASHVVHRGRAELNILINIRVDFIPEVTNSQVLPRWLTQGQIWHLVALLAQQWGKSPTYSPPN